VYDPKSPKRFVTAPVSHQKQPEQTKTNTIEIERKPSKINEADRFSAAHNGLVAGSSSASFSCINESRMNTGPAKPHATLGTHHFAESNRRAVQANSPPACQK
jgi:hypothetical protein